MIGGDDISNDVINLGRCFFNVCLHSHLFPLRANWQKSDSSVNGEPQVNWRWNSNSRDLVASSPSFPPPPPALPESPRECSRRLIDALWKMKAKLLLFVCLLFCQHLQKTFLLLGSKYNVLLAFVGKPEKRYQLGKHGRAENSYVGQGHLEEMCSCSAIVALVVIVVGKQILSLTFFFVVRAGEWGVY